MRGLARDDFGATSQPRDLAGVTARHDKPVFGALIAPNDVCRIARYVHGDAHSSGNRKTSRNGSRSDPPGPGRVRRNARTQRYAATSPAIAGHRSRRLCGRDTNAGRPRISQTYGEGYGTSGSESTQRLDGLARDTSRYSGSRHDLSRCHPSLRLFDDMVVFECCRFPAHFGQPGERECGQSHDDIAYRNVIEVGGDQVRRYAEEPRTRDVQPRAVSSQPGSRRRLRIQ